MINLQKGQKVDIGLSRINVGLGWSPNAGTGADFDLDASAFMLDANRHLVSESHFIFYNNTTDPEASMKHSGDDPTGGNSTGGDDEVLELELDKVSAAVQEIVFVVTIHDFVARKQNFGQVRGSYIRLLDTVKAEEIAKYELDEDFSVETAVEFGRLYRRDGKWRFEASGIGYREDLTFFLTRYAPNVKVVK